MFKVGCKEPLYKATNNVDGTVTLTNSVGFSYFTIAGSEVIRLAKKANLDIDEVFMSRDEWLDLYEEPVIAAPSLADCDFADSTLDSYYVKGPARCRTNTHAHQQAEGPNTHAHQQAEGPAPRRTNTHAHQADFIVSALNAHQKRAREGMTASQHNLYLRHWEFAALHTPSFDLASVILPSKITLIDGSDLLGVFSEFIETLDI